MSAPTPPIEEALIALGGILADEETPCPSPIGEEIESIMGMLEKAQAERDELMAALRDSAHGLEGAQHLTADKTARATLRERAQVHFALLNRLLQAI